MDKRYLIAGAAAGVGLLVTSVALALRFGIIRRLPVIGPNPNHEIVVHNRRETAHDVAVEYQHRKTTREHGPWRIKPGERWGVTRIEKPGTLTVTVSVDDEKRLEDTHEIPIPEEGTSTFVISLNDRGFVTGSVRRGESIY